MYCRERSVIASTPFGEVAAAIKCRSWLCPECAVWRQKCLMSQCIIGKPNRFLTITCRPGEFGSMETNAKAIAAAWRTVVQRWRRLAKWHKCEYICVFEPHESGWPHLHVLWRGHWIGQAWLSEQMSALLNSPVVHVSRIKGAKSAAYYVAKYFSKTPTRFGTAKRYWTSKNYGKCTDTDAEPVFRKGIPKTMSRDSIDDHIRDWHRRSKVVWYVGTDIAGWGTPMNIHELKDPPRNEHLNKVYRRRRRNYNKQYQEQNRPYKDKRDNG